MTGCSKNNSSQIADQQLTLTDINPDYLEHVVIVDSDCSYRLDTVKVKTDPLSKL